MSDAAGECALRAFGVEPVGALDLSPPGVAATARVGGKSSGNNPAKTNEAPRRSAVVTHPVAATNRAKSALVTAWAPISNASSATSWAGPSPSPG